MENKIARHLKNSLVAGALALGSCISQPLDVKPKVSLGYNALETAVVAERSPEGNRPVRNRLLSNVSLGLGDLEISYQGLNEVNDWNSDTYFGRNRFIVGNKDSPLKFLVDTRAVKDDVFDKKIGVRHTKLMSQLGGYGFVDLSTDKDSLNLALFYGKPLCGGLSLEVLQDTTFRRDQEPSYYTELQLNQSLTDKLSLFVRAEIPNFDEDLATYLLGASISF